MIKKCAGIIVRRKRGEDGLEFFLCTPGGPAWVGRECWNFPKGEMEENENILECAIREFKEETGVDISVNRNDNDFNYEGVVRQRKDKEVYVYSTQWIDEPLDNETCHSNEFLWTDGKNYPEIGEYRWMTLSELVGKGIPKYYPIFEDINMRTFITSEIIKKLISIDIAPLPLDNLTNDNLEKSEK